MQGSLSAPEAKSVVFHNQHLKWDQNQVELEVKKTTLYVNKILYLKVVAMTTTTKMIALISTHGYQKRQLLEPD